MSKDSQTWWKKTALYQKYEDFFFDRQTQHFHSQVPYPPVEADDHNIRKKLQELALQDTANFVQVNMKDVPAFSTGAELLLAAFQEIPLKKSGLICEFGVFSGATVNMLAKMTDQTVYGFDSFQGLPENWRRGFPKGLFSVSELPKVRSNVVLVKGLFANTLPTFLKQHPQDALFLHIDSDLYSSAQTVFQLLQKRIKKGTIIVFDEFFNYPGWREGEYKAFTEFVKKTKLKYRWIGYCEYDEQVAVQII